MVPAGDPTQETVDKLAELLDEGDTIIDGGNSKFKDDIARAEALKPKGIHYVDVGTSGGVWGLEVGYCMMVGGPDEAVEPRRADPRRARPAEHRGVGPGWGHMGPTGSGHYVKMVHNGIEYGMMQAYAEGFDLFHSASSSSTTQKIAKLWMQGSVIRSWLCELAARAFEQDGNDLAPLKGFVERLRRGPLDDRGGDRQRRADAGDHHLAVRPLLLARQRRLHGAGCSPRCATSSAATRSRSRRTVDGDRRPARQDRAGGQDPLVEGLERLPVHPTNLVIFGATGDLAQAQAPARRSTTSPPRARCPSAST